MDLSRERNKRNSSFSLLSTEIGWPESIEPRFKVHLLDEGYTWVPTTRNLVEDFVFGEEKLEIETLTSLKDLQSSGGHLASGQDLKSKYSTRATRGYWKL